MLSGNSLFWSVIGVLWSVDLVPCIRFEIGSCVVQYLEPCSQEIIKFYLFSSNRHENGPILINPDNITLPKWVNWRHSNKLIVHGYGGSLEYHATKAIRNAYLNVKNTNVIIVDWGQLSQLPCYPTAAINTKQAGECTAHFLIKLKKFYGSQFKLNRFHGIGFSLGAHIVSFVSDTLKEKLNTRLWRITGLDPALPFFATSDNTWKLDPGDANFVDVIHTNAGVFGKIEPCGHIDFYVNGGQTQPACLNHRNVPLCSHLLAAIYFAESISTEVGFWGIPCHSYFQYVIGMCSMSSRIKTFERILMGEQVYMYNTTENPRIVLIDTNIQPPYALGLQ